jgi:hypothetical protein
MLWTTRLGRRNRRVLAFVALLVALVGCQLVVGIQTRKLDPIDPGCVLPTGSGPQVRVGNLAPTSDLVDVCIRNAGSSDWGRPIILDGGTDCATPAYLGAVGFAYGQVSVAFSAPSASVDVKVIPGGSTCSAAALGEGDGVTLATSATTTLILIGGNNVAETVVALPEADAPNNNYVRFRLVHAAAGTGPLDFGEVAQPQLPTTLSIPFLSAPIAFGGSVPSGATSSFASATLLDNGYVALLEGTFEIGAATHGDASKKALFVYQTSGKAATYSMYAIGIEGDNSYPLRALVCAEDATVTNPTNPLVEKCATSELSSISVDVYNPGLYGPNSPDFNERDPGTSSGPIPTAIAQRTSDIICLNEVDLANDQANIIAAATAAGYTHGYTVTTDLSTPFTNPADQNGNVPPAPTEPPCFGVSSDLVNGAVSCAEQSCSTQPPGDGTGVLNGSTDCLVSQCAPAFINLQTAMGNGIACFDCIVVNIASDQTFGSTQSTCMTNTAPPLGFNGAENSLILSRYPLAKTDALILPSTDYRRSVLYASVQLEDQAVDFYCGFLMSTENATALPYVGSYGNGATDSQTGWDNEQLYEAQQLVVWVQKKSGSNPAIVVGDWHASVGVDPDAGAAPPGTFLPNSLNLPTMMALHPSGWTFAVPGPTSGSAWQPQCSVCPPPENPYNGATDQYFFSQPILVNWPQPTTATTDESLIFSQNVIPLPGPDAGEGPLSPYYGVNFRVIRPH